MVDEINDMEDMEDALLIVKIETETDNRTMKTQA